MIVASLVARFQKILPIRAGARRGPLASLLQTVRPGFCWREPRGAEEKVHEAARSSRCSRVPDKWLEKMEKPYKYIEQKYSPQYDGITEVFKKAVISIG